MNLSLFKLKRFVLPFSLLLLLLGLNACARTALRGAQKNSRRIIFQFTTEGPLALSNENVTYYIVLNAPQEAGKTLDPNTEGPYVNGTDLNSPPTILKGRLPFTGLLPGDTPSVWTHFYYLRGTANGKGEVGRGVQREDGTPEIVERNYSETLWRKVSDTTAEIQILFSDLFPNADTSTTTNGSSPYPNNIAVNLASSDNIDTGQGFLFDYWLANQPFAISTEANNSPIQNEDTNTQIIMRVIPGKNVPQLPTGVLASSVNIVGYQYRVLDL